MVIAVGPRRAFPFLNRVDERATMKMVRTQRRAERRPCLILLHGPEGIGRTSVASEFYHDDFDGTYIEVVARRPDGRPVPYGELMSQALRGLGQPDTDQAASDMARAQAYQLLSAGRRFFMMIKDVVNVEQVVSLIPAAAAEAVVVVTSSTLLRGLLRHDFTDLPVRRFPSEESRKLLIRCLADGVAKIPPATISELAELCDGIPLLVRILGAQLVRREHAAARYLADLRSSELALLAMDDSRRMAGFLNVTYDLLEPAEQRAYRRLSLLPGPSFDAAAAAVALEQKSAERVLDELVDANLLIFAESRYSFYRIVRADARRRLLDADDPEVVQAAIERITVWYLREAIPRDAALADRWRVGPEFEREPEPMSRAAATAWFEAEWTSVVAAVRLAHDAGLHAIAWQLCVAVFKYLHIHGHVDAWLDSHQLGVESARAAGDQLGVMQVTSQRGAAYLAIGDPSRARADFEASLRAAVQAGHRLGEQSAWEWLGKTAAADGDVDSAFRCYAKSEAMIEADMPARQRTRMLALLNLQRGRASLMRREWDQAVVTGDAAVRYFESSDEAENYAKCLLVLGDAAMGHGDFARAATHFEQAVGLFAGDRARRAEAGALRKRGEALAAGGDTAGAVEALRSARALYLKLGDATADTVAARLSEL